MGKYFLFLLIGFVGIFFIASYFLFNDNSQNNTARKLLPQQSATQSEIPTITFQNGSFNVANLALSRKNGQDNFIISNLSADVLNVVISFEEKNMIKIYDYGINPESKTVISLPDDGVYTIKQKDGNAKVLIQISN